MREHNPAIRKQSRVLPMAALARLAEGDQVQAEEDKGQTEAGEVVDWRDVALRLKARWAYRKRQSGGRRTRSSASEQFLRSFLGIADDLEQALKLHPALAIRRIRACR